MKGNILIVDDDPDTVEMLRLVLSEAGYTTRAAATGFQALATARQTPPGLVLLDLMLPDQNGFYLCEALRRNAVTACIPIIMMTALPGEIPRLAGIEAGADAYLNKPLDMDGLVALVDDLLRGTRPPVAVVSEPALAASVPLPPASWNEPVRPARRAFV
jgi:adenylate cyclase